MRTLAFVAGTVMLLQGAAPQLQSSEPVRMPAMRVVVVGLKPAVVEDARTHLNFPGVEVVSATTMEDLRAAFASSKVNTVIIGAGLDLETRLEMIRTVYSLSETTTVHMKDRASGPQGFLPFIRRSIAGERSDPER